MRRLGLTGLNTRPRPARRGGRGPVAHEDHCAHQWDQGTLDHVRITDFLPTCDARKAGATCTPWAMRTHAQSWDTPRASSKAPTWSSPPSTWPPPPVAPSPQGSCFMLIEEHSSPPRNWPPTCAPPKQPCRWDGQECAGITPWPNPCGPPHNRLLLPAHLHHPRPGLHRGRHLDRRLLQPPPNPHQPRRQIPHRIRTTPSGMDNSHINKPPTTCTQTQPVAR